MVYLRRLRKEDAPFMLEWMHDAEIQSVFAKDMASITIEQALTFISSADVPSDEDRDISQWAGKDIHFAIASNESDEYLGTISLKNINLKNCDAEYAISTRQSVHGTGAAAEATNLLLKKAFDVYELHRVYLNVLSENKRAMHFYEKCGFQREGEFRDAIQKNDKYMNLSWYSMLADDFHMKNIG